MSGPIPRRTIAVWAVGLFTATAALSAVAADDPPRLRWEKDSERGARVVVEGLDRARLDTLETLAADSPIWVSFLDVRLAGASRPLLGEGRVVGDRAEFRPKFPLEPGSSYTATMKLAGKATTAAFTLADSKPTARATRVLRVAPALDVVPENLLKIYVTFSAPMRRGEVYRRVRLVDVESGPVDLPFLELGEELWDKTQTRITLLFDPGRIKHGLRPREEEGPILRADRSYRFEIDAAWPDAAGKPLAEGFRWTFRAASADAVCPDPKTWKLEPPPSGGRRALTLRFEEPLDDALASRLITVETAEGEAVEGRAEVDRTGRVWSFRPKSPWTTEPHRVAVDPRLEDLAGNSVAKPFEVDVFVVDRPEVVVEPVYLPFTPRGD
ncbi:MAG: hypothetical protein SFX72_23260 [Isosphaeraceae bacterium]|nr:hypothetical protein [Isosphaeraceae bacterium]